MKKIYMILAAITLLSMSLNAQSATPVQKYKAFNKTQIYGQDKGQAAQSVGALRAPNRYNAANGEFLVGPYTTDDFSTTGKGLYSTTSYGRIDIAAILDRSEIEQYIGQEIVGYRFATTGKVSCYDFHVWIEGPNHYVTDIHTFNLQESGAYVDVSGTQWHEYYLDEPVAFAVPDSAITVWIGYKYYQESSTSDGYTMTPILVNPNSTSHSTYAYSYYNEEFYDVTTTLGGDLAAQLIFKQAVPKVAISPETQTINDAAAGTLTITGTNIEGNINVSLANTTDWYLNPTSFSNTGGTASVSYTGRALSASNTVTAEAANDNTVTDEATVNYVADLYIVTDNGVQGDWHFDNGTQMTNNNGVYTATFTATNPNTYILFARKLGNDVTWNTRYVFGPNSGGDWVWGEYTGGNIDVNDDDPIKLPNAGTYTITINANDGTFTITKETPVLTAPTTGSTINVGTHSGNGVSKNVNIKGNNLTQDLTVNVSGTGFSISRAVTVTAAEANSANGQDVIVTYNGTDANATGTLTVQSSEIGTVTAQLTASYGSTPSGETGTVGNGATSDFYLPAYGSYQDYGYKNQMIYTADKLAEAGIQAGDQITSITFYPTTASGYNGGIDFYGSTVTLSLGNTEVSSFSGSKITPSDLTDVVTITPVRDNNATEWTFSWSTPFTYTGENLLVQVYCPGYEHDGTNGDYGRTYFKGDNQSSNVGLYSYNSSSYSTSGTSGTSGTNRQFLPQATFTYLTNTNPVLTAPQDGDNVSFGPYEAPATNASTTITVKGRNLTEALSVSVSGTGFHVLTNSVSAADANAGTTITVTYDGTDPTATGTLTITSGNGEVSTVTVNLTSGYIAHDPVLTAPTSGTTIDVGNNTGAGTSTTVTVTGNYLTQDLNVSVSGAGFRVSPETISYEDVNDGTATITIFYTGTNPNATGSLTIASVNGEVSVTVPLTATFSTGIEPVVHGMVRMGTLPIVDQFAEEIPPTNDHPYRYTYYLKLATRDTTSSPARVPAQHTGAVIEGYYSLDQMDNDTDPDNFLTVNMLSAEVDMNLSPASAPYFYTVNSVLNGVPQHADDWDSYLNVLQRREAGDYQEMQTAYTYDENNPIPNPNKYKIYESGENSFVDYRDIQAASHLDSLSYVPIVWTKGIDRYYYTSDSLHNSYGAPLWEVRIGRVEIQKPTYERQAKNAAGDWNASVNWYDEEGNACSLFAIKSLHATGYLPIGNVEYEPYMFRLWVECDGLRNMNQVPGTGAVNDTTSSLRKSPKLLYTKYCHGADDLYLDIDKDENNWDNNIYFGGLNTIKPKFIVRFYYTVKGHQKPLDAKSTRAEGDDEDHVGYVVQEEADPYDPSTVIYEVIPTGEIVNQIFYNVQGMQSNKPFDGVNIVVTTYSDGSVTTTKVVR